MFCVCIHLLIIIPKYSWEKKYTHLNFLSLGCVQFSCGGEKGIRTLAPVSWRPHFECGSLWPLRYLSNLITSGKCPTCVIYNISPDLATILRQFCKNPLIPTAARNKKVMRGKYFVKKRLSEKHNGIRKRKFYRSDDEKSPTFFVIRKRRARRAPTA